MQSPRSAACGMINMTHVLEDTATSAAAVRAVWITQAFSAFPIYFFTVLLPPYTPPPALSSPIAEYFSYFSFSEVQGIVSFSHS